MKRYFSIFLTALIFCANTSNVFAQEQNLPEISKSLEIIGAKNNRINSNVNISKDDKTRIFIDGDELDDTNCIIYENRTYLPIRTLGEKLGFSVDYIPEDKIVIVNSGKIQLPVLQNKAVVDGKIVPIDATNNKIGTIVVDGVTYLPLRFISENLGYKTNYEANRKIVDIATGKVKYQLFDKESAIKEYAKISKANDGIKSRTLNATTTIDASLKSGTDVINNRSTIETLLKLENGEKANLYGKQKVKFESLGEQEIIEQSIFYKDGYIYIEEGGEKIKIKCSLEDALKIVDEQTNYIDIVVDGRMKELGNGKREYSFNIDLSKNQDLLATLFKDLNIGKEDLQVLQSTDIKMGKNRVTVIVDDKDMILREREDFDISINYQDLEIKNKIVSDMSISDVNKTFIDTPNEDLSLYQDIDTLEENK